MKESNNKQHKSPNEQSKKTDLFNKYLPNSGNNSGTMPVGIHHNIMSYLDAKSINRYRASDRKSNHIFEVAQEKRLLAYRNLQRSKSPYGFISLIYKSQNIEKLLKIIDEVAKTDMEKFFCDKTDDEIANEFVRITAGTSSNYEFKESVYSMLELYHHHCYTYNHRELVELVLWHMVLLDILNIKFSDLKYDKPLEEAITDTLKQNSDNRLKFFFNQAKSYESMTAGGALYEYSRRIFKDLPEKQGENKEQEQLMRKIFAHFLAVSFYRMKQIAPSDFDENNQANRKYQLAIKSFSRYFYISENGIDNSKYIDCVKATDNDLAICLFMTGELEPLFYSHDFNVVNHLCEADHYVDLNEIDNSTFCSFDFLFYLNKIKPLEQQYKDDTNKFIQDLFPGTKKYWAKSWSSVDHLSNILTYFNNEKLFKEAKDYLIEYFHFSVETVKRLNDNIQQNKELLGTMSKDNSKLSQSEPYFYDMVKRFVGDEKCKDKNVPRVSDEEIRRVSMMLCESNVNVENVVDQNQIMDNEQKNNSVVSVSDIDSSKDKNNGAIADLSNEIKNEPIKDDNKHDKEKRAWHIASHIKFFFVGIRNFFHSIRGRISNFFCRQPEKIEVVELKNNPVVEDINSIKSQNFKVPETNNLNAEKKKDI